MRDTHKKKRMVNQASSESFGARVQAPASHKPVVAATGWSRPTSPMESSLDQKNDEALITLFQEGEEGAFRLLVDRYQEKIRNLVYSIFNEPEVVDDISQEVFIKAYEGLRNFRFQSSLYTWLYRIAVNRCRDEMRRRKIRKYFSLQSMMESNDTEFHEKMTTNPDSNDAREIVDRGLKQLPEKFRVAIILKDIEGCSYEQMADVMQCQIGTVKSRLSRARSMMRKAVQPLLEEAAV